MYFILYEYKCFVEKSKLTSRLLIFIVGHFLSQLAELQVESIIISEGVFCSVGWHAPKFKSFSDVIYLIKDS